MSNLGDQRPRDERGDAEGNGRADVEDEGEGAHPLLAGVRGQVCLGEGKGDLPDCATDHHRRQHGPVGGERGADHPESGHRSRGDDQRARVDAVG